MNKYVNPTGDGYLGVAKVSTRGGAGFGVGMFPVDWDGNTTVATFIEEPGVAVVAVDEVDEGVLQSDDFLAEYKISIQVHGNIGPSLSIGTSGLRPLDLEEGDDVRAYERDGGGLMLVPSKNDPFVDEI